MAAQGTTPASERPSTPAPADPKVLAHLLRIEKQAERQVARERKCAYGAVKLGKEMQWVKERHAYTLVNCASYNLWVKRRLKLGRSQGALYCSLAPLPLRLVRGRALSLGRLQIIVKAPAWLWPVLCKHGHRPSSEARLRAAVVGGEEHLAAHQDQAQALCHVKAVLEGAEPFRRNPEPVPLDEAVAALQGGLTEVKRAARALGALKDLAGQSAQAGPWVERLIKAAAIADGEVQAVLQRFRNPESPEEKSREDKDFGERGAAAGGGAPAPRRAAKTPAPSAAVSAPLSAEPPVAASATAVDEPPSAASATAVDEPPSAASATAAPPAAATTLVQVTDVCAGLAGALTLPEQQRLSVALLGLLIHGVAARALTAARAEISALCDKARSAEGPSGLPSNTLSCLSAALQQEPIEQRWPLAFNVLLDDALARTRPDLHLIDPARVPPACQETLRAALDRHHPPPPRLSDAERDAELVRLAAGVADQRAQLVLERKQRRPW